VPEAGGVDLALDLLPVRSRPAAVYRE